MPKLFVITTVCKKSFNLTDFYHICDRVFWQRMMERASHINIAMIEDIGTNGMSRSKVISAMDHNKQPCGSTVSFHNIQYKVQLKSGFLCKKKTISREILVDLKLVVKIASSDYLWGFSQRKRQIISWIWWIMFASTCRNTAKLIVLARYKHILQYFCSPLIRKTMLQWQSCDLSGKINAAHCFLIQSRTIGE